MGGTNEQNGRGGRGQPKEVPDKQLAGPESVGKQAAGPSLGSVKATKFLLGPGSPDNPVLWESSHYEHPIFIPPWPGAI